MREPILRGPSEGKIIAVAGGLYRFLATGEETNGKYATFEAIVPPGNGPPPHTHSREEESFYVLEGEIAFTTWNAQGVAHHTIARPGQFANMSIGTRHAFRNVGDQNARMIISVAPAGLEKMFLEAGQPASLDEPIPAASPAEIEKLIALGPNYGIQIVPPNPG